MSRLLALAVVVVVFTACAGTKGGAQIDDWCVAGQLRNESLTWLNEHPGAWKQHTEYQAPLVKRDRIVSRHCSDVLIALAAGDLAAAFEAFQQARQNDDGGQ